MRTIFKIIENGIEREGTDKDMFLYQCHPEKYIKKYRYTLTEYILTLTII